MNYYRIVISRDNFSQGMDFLIRHKCIMSPVIYTKKNVTIPFRTLVTRKILVDDCPDQSKVIQYREIPECFKKYMWNI